jgi:tRNA pseudouridine32 synthase/23S rRNA pseudouridine746 synthase
LIKPELHTIVFKENTLQWSCSEDETLLASAERQGIDLPSSCRTCLIKTQTSEYTYVVDWPGLSLDEKSLGFTLCCVAKPQGDVTIVDSNLSEGACAQAFQVVFEDTMFIALNKPSGLLSVPGRGELKSDCLSSRVQKKYLNAQIVHRLDQATSGLLIMALGQDHQRSLNKLFAGGLIRKTYIAQVQGSMPVTTTWKLIDAPIYADWSERPKRVVDPRGKPSQTRYRCIQSNAHESLLEVEPFSGRTHQIRVHLSHIGHPILGDRLYAPQDTFERSTRLLLHAYQLRFIHPKTHEDVFIQSDCPNEFTLERLT